MRSFVVTVSLALAVNAANVATSYGVELSRQDWPQPLACAALALTLTGISACAVNLFLGRASLALRSVALLSAVASGSLLLTCATRESWTQRDVRQWLAVLAVYTCFFLGPFVLAR